MLRNHTSEFETLCKKMLKAETLVSRNKRRTAPLLSTFGLLRSISLSGYSSTSLFLSACHIPPCTEINFAHNFTAGFTC